MAQCLPISAVALVVLFSLSAIDNSLAVVSNVDNGTTVDSQTTRPIDRGLRPLYVMTETFLDIVQPIYRGFVLDDARFNAVFTSKNLSAGLSVIANSSEDWQYYARHYIGFSVCIAFGIAFAILTPIVGLFVCCCRCCGRCGGKRGQVRSAKRDRCRRAVCGLLLLIFTTAITAGMVCVFVTNQLLHDVTKSQSLTSESTIQNAGLVDGLVLTLNQLRNYQDKTIDELRTTIVPPIYHVVNEIKRQLSAFPSDARQFLVGAIHLSPLLDAATWLNGSLIELEGTFEVVATTSRSLQEQQRNLTSSMNETRYNLLAILDKPQCNLSDSCKAALRSVGDMSFIADYSKFDDVTNQLKNVQSIINGSLVNKLKQVLVDSQSISSTVMDTIESSIRDRIVDAQKVVNSTAQTSINQIQQYVNSAVDAINSVNVTDVSSFLDRTVDPKLNEYGNYRYYGGIAIGCILVVIVLFNYLGLCFGACGETAGEDAGSCNRGVGAVPLLTSVSFVFLLSWLIMIVVTLLFVSGGFSYTDICRPAMNPQPNSSFYKTIDWAVDVSLQDHDVKFSYTGVMSQCKQNDGIYSSLNLDQTFNLSTQFMDVATKLNSSVTDVISKISGNLTAGSELLTPDVKQLLTDLGNSGIDNINFTSFYIVLSSPLLAVNLTQLASEVDQLANSSICTGSADTDCQSLRNEAQKLRAMNDRLRSVTAQASSLRQELQMLESEIYPAGGQKGFMNRTIDLVDALLNTQTFIKVNGTRLIRQYVTNFGYHMIGQTLSSLSAVLDQVQHGIGRCRPLYDSVQIVSSTICLTFLDPFNGFWFSVGWCVAFFIPTVIVSLYLATLYRASDDYGVADSKSFDEHIYRRRGRVHPTSGHHNTVYEPDINPPPPATLYSPYSPSARNVQSRNLAPSDPGFVGPVYFGNDGYPHPRGRNFYQER